MVLEAEVKHPFSQGDTLVFEPDWEELEGIGVELPDALLKQQPKGRIFIPAVNPEAISAWLEPGLCVGSVTYLNWNSKHVICKLRSHWMQHLV